MHSFTLRDLLEIFIRRVKILIFTIIGVIAIWAGYSLQTPVYKAELILQITQNQSALGGLGSLGEIGSSFGSPSANTQEEVMVIFARDTLNETVKRLHLNYQSSLVDNIFSNDLDYTSQKSYKNIIEINEINTPDRSKVNETLIISKNPDSSLNIYDKANDLLISDSYKLGESLFLRNVGSIVSIDKFDLKTDDSAEISYVSVATYSHKLKNELSSNIEGSASPFVSGGIIRLSLNNLDRLYLKDVLNTLAVVYKEKNISFTSQEASKSLKYINSLLPVVMKDLEKAEELLNSFRLENTPIDIQLETEAKLKEMVAIEEKLILLSLDEAQISQIYTETHPTYKTLSSQIKSLIEQKKAIEIDISKIPETQLEFMRLSRDVEANNAIYTELLSRKLQMQVLEAGAIGNVRVIDNAFITAGQVSPRYKVSLLLFSVLGSIVFIGIVIFLEIFARKLNTPSEVLSNFPNSEIFGLIPLTENEGINSEDDYSLAESFRTCATNIKFELEADEADNKKAKLISVNGSTPKVGKTYVSRRIAEAISSSSRVLLIDFDIRRGDIAKKYNLSKKGGLMDAANFDDIKIHQINDNLDFISTGRLTDNVTKILQKGYITNLIGSYQNDYEYIIFDTSPILSVADSLLLVPYMDLMLFVIRQGFSSVDEVNVSIDKLKVKEDSKFFYIFNGFKSYENIYGYKYHYNYQGYSKYNYEKDNE